MKKLFYLILAALLLTGAGLDAQTPYTKTFSPDGIVANRTGWSFWYMPTGVADTLNIKISCIDTMMYSHTPHQHAHDELFIVLEGDAILYMNGEETLLHPGDGLICPGNSTHNIQRTDPSRPIKYMMFTREARDRSGQVPHPFFKKDYKAADCLVRFRKNRNFWYLSPKQTLGDMNVRNVFVRGKKVRKNPAGGQLAYVIMEGTAMVTVDGVPVRLPENSVCYVPKGSASSIVALSDRLRYLEVRTAAK